MDQINSQQRWVEIEVFDLGNDINTVRYLRDRYSIMQKLLICKGISRPYLSNLENGKVEISHEMAYRISEKFNEVFADKGIDVRLDKEDLMNGKRLVNKLTLNNELALFEKIKNIDHEEVRLLEERYLVVESPYEYARLNSLLGNYYYNLNDKSKALRYLVKAFDAYVSKERLQEGLSILSRIIVSYIEINDLDAAKAYDDFFFTELIDECSKMDDRLEAKFYYNSALLNKKLGNYELALEKLDHLEKINSRRKQRGEYDYVLRANIYRVQQEFDKAEKVLSKLIRSTSDGVVKIYANITLLEVLADQEKIDAFKKRVRTAKHLLDDFASDRSEYALYMLSLMKLSKRIGDNKFILLNMSEMSSVLLRQGKKSSIEDFIKILNDLAGESSDANDLKAELVSAYFKL